MKIFSEIGFDHPLIIDRVRWKTFIYFFTETEDDDSGRNAQDNLDNVFHDGYGDSKFFYH